MGPCILRQVVYRPSDSDKPTWAIVLCQNGGLTLVFVPRQSQQQDHFIAVATENVQERLFEPVQGPQFSVEDGDLERIGEKLSALGDAVSDAKMEKLFEDLI